MKKGKKKFRWVILRLVLLLIALFILYVSIPQSVNDYLEKTQTTIEEQQN